MLILKIILRDEKLLSTFYRWWNPDTVSLKDMPKVTKLGSDGNYRFEFMEHASTRLKSPYIHQSFVCAGEEKGKVSHNSRSGNRLIISFSISVSTHHQSECVKQATYRLWQCSSAYTPGLSLCKHSYFFNEILKITSLCSISADSDKLLEKQKDIFWNSLKKEKKKCQHGSVGIWRPAVYTTLSSPLLCHCSLMYSHLSERHCENSLLWKSNVFVVR